MDEAREEKEEMDVPPWRQMVREMLPIIVHSPSDVEPGVYQQVERAIAEEPSWSDRQLWVWLDHFRLWYHVGAVSSVVALATNVRAYFTEKEPPREDGGPPSSTHWAWCSQESPHSQSVQAPEPIDEEAARNLVRAHFGPKEPFSLWPYDPDTGMTR